MNYEYLTCFMLIDYLVSQKLINESEATLAKKILSTTISSLTEEALTASSVE